MLILLYNVIASLISRLGTYAQGMIEPIMVIVITLAGIVMLFGAVGMKISTNLGSTVVNGIFKAIGYLGKQLIKAISWIFKYICNLIPKVFRGMNQWFIQLGLKPTLSRFFAVITTIIVILLII